MKEAAKQVAVAAMGALATLLMEAQSRNVEETEGKAVERLVDVSSLYRLIHCWNLRAQQYWGVIEKANLRSKGICIGSWVV